MATEIKGMVDSSQARDEILRRVRKANGGGAEAGKACQQWCAIERGYRRSRTRSTDMVLELLEDRLRDYDAHVERVAEKDVADTVAKMLAGRGLNRIVVPPGIEKTWLPDGFSFVVDKGLSAEELDGFEGVMTGATVAIAETGSVVLQNVAGQGRRAATLVPDYHLCVVRTRDVVETVPEAIEWLRASPELPTTFFSGPSATADIEMTRIKGVHGPRFLDVVLTS